MALSELGKRAKIAIAKKGLKPTVRTNYGLDYQKKMLRQLERIMQGTSKMSIENQNKLYKNLTNSILKHSKQRESEAIAIQLKKFQGNNAWKIFTKKQGRLQIGSKVKLPTQILAEYANIATQDPQVYIQSLIDEKQGFINKVALELGEDLSDLTDTEWKLIQEAADAHEDYHGKYSGWYWVLQHLDEVYSMRVDRESLITQIDEGDVLSLIMFERTKTLREKQETWQRLYDKAKTLRENQETWQRAYDKVIEENNMRINKGKHASLVDYLDVMIANPTFTSEGMDTLSQLGDYYIEHVNGKGTTADFMQWLKDESLDDIWYKK